MSGVRGFVVALAALGAASAPAASPDRRVSAIIIPLDRQAEAAALRIESYASDALREFRGLELRTSDELFGVARDEAARASLARAGQLFADARATFDARAHEDAEKKLKATIKEFGRAAAVMESCAELCEAVAMYAAVLQARGDVEEARLVIIDLVALSPSFELDRRRFTQNFVTLKAQVEQGRTAQLRGNLEVSTSPPGARVSLDGAFQCYAPCTLQTLRIGKHLVRVERPGFREAGALVEVTPEDQPVPFELVATSGYRAFDGLMDRLAAEALAERGGSAMASVGTSLKLDRAVIGVLKGLGDRTELVLGYYDLKSGRRHALRRATFQGDEHGQLEGEVARMVNSLLNTSASERAARGTTGDPLDGRAGTEDWSADDVGGRNTEREKKKKGGGDPLEGVSGTEDW